MKRRSFVLFLSALTMSAALIGTSPVLAETKETTEVADSKDEACNQRNPAQRGISD